jgi:hypothetical protein
MISGGLLLGGGSGGLEVDFVDLGGLPLRLPLLAFRLAFHEEVEVLFDGPVEAGFVEGEAVDGFVVVEEGPRVADGVFDFETVIGEGLCGLGEAVGEEIFFYGFDSQESPVV